MTWGLVVGSLAAGAAWVREGINLLSVAPAVVLPISPSGKSGMAARASAGIMDRLTNGRAARLVLQ